MQIIWGVDWIPRKNTILWGGPNSQLFLVIRGPGELVSKVFWQNFPLEDVFFSLHSLIRIRNIQDFQME